ncbi:erythrocyte membrane protein 1, PfEMP1, putative [Plasmodium reichenowi]|uniref:Erythrocyte membrane protein 1, PfEMP1, putative n=1 Tax=Plasmodium reichenowi TaxID=5854 RepID=A0A2P9D9L8_PLARE|nr:erythrocyte membrane protein 1, PfEMP1, putative [Plasmodium reichenowi]
MVPPPRASSAKEPDYDKVNNAKDLFDEVGKYIKEKVHEEALERGSGLKGLVEYARFRTEEGNERPPSQLCKLNYEYDTNVTSNVIEPCKYDSEKRFSDEGGAECDNSKIKGNDRYKTGGACAPYRRLHLCDRNLEQIQPDKIDNTHNLLVDVCLAAQFEGKSISDYYRQYQAKYGDTGSTICTELARSFADIGDIIRGKDLYLGNRKKKQTEREKEILENNLRKIFENIQKNNSKLTGLSLDAVREYWWELNRQTVWKALTCDDKLASAHYFRQTCSGGRTMAHEKCTCANGDPPTYFDYVPQFLRWFEEWAEDFCRIKRRKLQKLEKECRDKGEDGKKRYCSRNAHDCAQTVRARGELVMGNRCIKCFYACPLYEKWIDNQKQEFQKQKNKYNEEIKIYENGALGNKRKKRGISTNFEGYDRKFYDEFKSRYNDVNDFLNLLNNEKECTKNADIKEGGKIDFRENHNKNNNIDKDKRTFYRSEYCEPCPDCGVTCDSITCTERKRKNEKEECPSIYKIYTTKSGAEHTPIRILKSGDGEKEIKEKLDAFCKEQSDASLYEEWKCYKEDDIQKDGKKLVDGDLLKGAGGLCILEKEGDKNGKKQKTFNNFFYYWVAHMLKDSVYWKKKLRRCLKKGTKKCGNNCKEDCGCFEKWIDQKKKKEWKPIRNHFYTQKGFGEEIGEALPYYVILESVLEGEFLKKDSEEESEKNSKTDDEGAQEIKRIKKLVDKIKEERADNPSSEETIIDLLFKEEEDDSTKCKKCKDPEQNFAGRSLPADDAEDDSPKIQDNRKNPCSGESGGDSKRYPVVAGKVAKTLQGKAQTQLDSNVGTRDALKGNIKNAEFKKGGNGSDLADGKICSIDEKKHTNDGRVTEYGPCQGKGNGLDIVDIGRDGISQSSIPGVYIRPRRKHMCTSNLEKIDSNWFKTKSNVNDTFLGDVLLSANYEAQKIKQKYKDSNDIGGKCRAMKSSFADIGDIIRGRDLWYKNGGSREMETHLKAIFNKMKTQLPREIQKKYSNHDGKHTELRKDWWEANRSQVWDAMKCHTSGMNCEGGTPYEDYIPQRLRWMTEWAEWYCKEQSQAYDKLWNECRKCKGKGKGNGENCYKETLDCSTCTQACTEYTKFIEKWKPQWKQMEMKYGLLYLNAQNTSGAMVMDDYPDQQQVAEFFKELKEEYKTATKSGEITKPSATTPITPYATAPGYIHQEAHIGECQEQKEFCFYKNGITPTSRGNVNEKYAFKDTPKDHDKACACTGRDPPRPGRSEDFAGRSAAPRDPETDSENSDESDNDFDGDNEDEDLDEDKEEETKEDVAKETTVETKETTTTEKSVDVCSIVNGVFTDGKTLQEACPTKYGKNNSRLGWRCIPTGNGSEATSKDDSKGDSEHTRKRRDVSTPGDKSGPTSSDSGAICIPPRRRRLYIGGLKKWANNYTGTTVDGKGDNGESGGSSKAGSSEAGNGQEAVSSGSSSEASSTSGDTTLSPSSDVDPLLAAFVESAAVETFFLWDRYKKIKDQEDIENQTANGKVVDTSNVGNKLQNDLEKGEIPEEFKRQMFYTIADYRDILVHGGTSDSDNKDSGSNNNNIVLNAGGNKEEMEAIQKKITDILNKTNSDSKSGENPNTNREEFWNHHGKSIWEGMVCALSYDTNTASVQTPKQDEKVKEILMKKLNSNYKYEAVTFSGGFDESSDTEAKKPDDSPTTTTKLKNFIKRPTYFRWLEEWGDEFCRKQKHKLEIIRVDCKVEDGGEKKCSGDGLECTKPVPEKKEIFKNFNCHSCGKSCRWYKKWIKTKKTEFEKQQKAYDGQKKNCKEGSGGGAKQFCETLETTSPEAKDFLDNLKGKPCKNNDESGQGKKGEDEIKFDVNGDTFKYEKYCGTCPQFKVECNGSGNCSGTNDKCKAKNGKISTEDIESMKTNTQEVVMSVSDNTVQTFHDGLDVCKGAGIFTGIKENKYKCGNVCGVDICTLEKTNNTKGKVYEHITVKEFVKRWLENFFDDYNRIRTKLKSCTNSGKEFTCIKNCVDKWITKKRGEWDDIKKKYIQEYTKNNDAESNDLSSFLEGVPFRNEVDKAIKPCKSLGQFEKSKKCNNTANSKKSEDDTKYDGILCLLDKLSKKCEEDHTNSVQTSQTSGVNPETCGENSTLVGDDDDDPLEENTVENMRPNICPKETVEDKKKEEEGDCDEKDEQTVAENEKNDDIPPEDTSGENGEPGQEGPSSPPTHSEGEGDKNQVPEETKNEVTKYQPAPGPGPQPPSPLPSDEPTNSISDILSSTIPFGIAIALTSIAFLFLKKKTKSSVDMLRVMEIPQNDYGMPTLKSSNRYIPYASGKYRGKRYIYIEGDSGTDSGYTDHYSDITSSSESEYEELDISDIYPYQSPKYKTLIEVVLEPSYKNTPSSDIPSDTPSNKFTEKEWNELKHDFISNMLQNTQNTEPNILHDNVDNNTHPTPSHNKLDQKPFIMSIHDRNLYTGEEYNYDMNTNSGETVSYSGIDPTSDKNSLYSCTKDPISGENSPYSGIDLINDALSGGNQPIDIYDEMLKRKENELFGTNHVKQTSTYSVAKPTRDDPIHNQLDLFHQWLDRHRYIYEKWDKNNKKEEILDKLKDEWNKDTNSGNIHPSDIPSGNNIHSDIQTSDIPSSNKMLNSDVSIQIHMYTNQVEDIYLDTYPDKHTMDSNPNLTLPSNPNLVGNINPNLVENINPNLVDSNNMEEPTEIQIELDVNNHKLVKEKYPIGDVCDI